MPEIPIEESVCVCGHWYNEHTNDPEGMICGGCDASGMDEETILHEFIFDPEENTPEAIADRGGDPDLWPQWVKNARKPEDYPYPTEEEEERLRTFSGTWREYMAYLQSIGNYWNNKGGEPWGWHEADEESDLLLRMERAYYVSTGGWSGNEELISILQEDFFWVLFWEESRRGGHYIFRIPLDQLDQPVTHISNGGKGDASA